MRFAAWPKSVRVVLNAAAMVGGTSLAACAPPSGSGVGAEGYPVTIAFEARVGDVPFSCSSTYANVGTSGSTLTPVDFRLFVHDVRLLLSDGEEVAVSMEDDGVYQDGVVALLDFEDGTGACADAGNTGLHTALRGTVASDPGTPTGVRFTLGVPFERNHDNPAVAAPPLNDTSMSWSWQGGMKFLKVDARTTGLPGGYFLHVGSTGCDGDPASGDVTGCSSPNRVDVELAGFDPTARAIGVDLGALLSGSDVDVDAGGAPGCMSQQTDPDCAPIFARLGLAFGDQTASSPALFVAP